MDVFNTAIPKLWFLVHDMLQILVHNAFTVVTEEYYSRHYKVNDFKATKNSFITRVLATSFRSS